MCNQCVQNGQKLDLWINGNFGYISGVVYLRIKMSALNLLYATTSGDTYTTHFIHATYLIESTKTTPMEDVSTGVLEKSKEYLRSKNKAKNDMMCQDNYNCICQNTKKWICTIHYVKPTAQLLFKNRYPKVDQRAWGKWLIHDTKCPKDNQLQSLKLPCRISKLSS